MVRRPFALWVPLLLAPFASGCFDFNTPAFRIPEPTMGESWTRSISLTQTDAHGLVSSVKARQEFRFADAVEAVPDRFGFAVDAVMLHSTFKDEATGASTSFDNAVETGGGNWLFYSMVPYAWHYALRATLFGFPVGTCTGDVRADGSPEYAERRVPYGEGNLWGRRLRPGDTFTEYSTVASQFGDLPARSDYAVGTETHITSPLTQKDVQVVPVDLATTVRVKDPVTQLPTEYKTGGTFYMADGVAHPLRFVAESESLKAQIDLVAHHPGTRRLPIRGGPVEAHFAGVHPNSVFVTPTFAPDTASLHLEFPFDDLVEKVRLDPRTRATGAFLADNPKAYVVEASYLRDAPNATYRWIASFTDGRDVQTVNATRAFVAGVVPIDEFHERASRPRTSPMKPTSVSELVVVPIGLGVAVAQKFLEGGGNWSSLGWRYDGLMSGTRWLTGPTIYYSVGLGGTGDFEAPARVHHHFWQAPLRTVDGRHGGLVPGSAERADCTFGLELRLPS